MNQADAEKELRARLYTWASDRIAKEVSESFPSISKLQHDRAIRCFLAWMTDLPSERRLPLCLATVRRNHGINSSETGEDIAEQNEEGFDAHNAAYHHYHHKLPPCTDCDSSASDFVKADTVRCRNAIMAELEPMCGRPIKREKTKIWCLNLFGDWELITAVEIRGRGGIPDRYVTCCHYLLRHDFPQVNLRYLSNTRLTRIDVLSALGITWSRFHLISQKHEPFCAQAVRDSVQILLPDVPGLVAGLGIND